MLRHNILIALRKFRNNKISFAINLIGLSAGLACALFILLWVKDECSVDKFHKQDDQVHQVLQNYEFPNGIETTDFTPLLLASAMQESFPDIVEAVNISSLEESPKGILTVGQEAQLAQGVFASEKFFDVFSYPWIEEGQHTFPNSKISIAISEPLARKLFNSADVVGKTISWQNDYWKDEFKITGVFRELPENATQRFDFVMNMQHLYDDEHAVSWRGDYVETFLALNPETDIDDFNREISGFIATQMEYGENVELFVQKFSDKYLHGNYSNGKISGGRIGYVRLFSTCAFLILFIACINFTNLSTAQTMDKLKEVGVKKALGASRSSLIRQYLSESIALAIISLCVALIFVHQFLPQFNDLANKSIDLNLEWPEMLFLVSLALITGLLAGSYSAFYLSRLQAHAVLKGKGSHTPKERWFRRGLVISQFSLTVMFLIGVLVIQKQHSFIHNKNIGFSRSNILTFERPGFRENSNAFLHAVEDVPGVILTSSMFDNILSGGSHQSGYYWNGEESNGDYLFKSPSISYDVIEALGITLARGRTYSRDFADERTKIIINESAQKMMGLDDPIGKKIGYGHMGGEREIIGVVADFQYGTIYHKMEPLIFRFTEQASTVLVKLKDEDPQDAIAGIGAVFKTFHPKYPFSFTFLDSDYQQLYEAEERVAILSRYFSLLAIIISCMGLLGLTLFTVVRKRKEIGIRKVLGASVYGISIMLTKSFTKNIVIAIVIALPLSVLLVQAWLSNFAYHIELSPWMFIGPSLAVLLLAWLTIASQTISAASANPALTLKDE